MAHEAKIVREMDWNNDFGMNTVLSHFGEGEKILGAVTPPIFQNSLFVFDTVEELFDSMTNHPGGPKHHYSRMSNPTVDLAEKKIAKLEGADACKLGGSGMASIVVAIMSCIEAGSHIVTLDTAYGPVRSFISDYLNRFGVTVTYVDGLCTDDLLDAIRPETKLVYLESPSSILFRLQDVGRIAKVCKEKGVATAMDNTYNTPVHMNPHKFGIDMVCHSATKYLGGHSDITAGVVTGSRERIDKIQRNEIAYFGSLLHPFSAWLLNRGLRTLTLRMKRHEATGNTVAGWLEDQPEIERVHHVGLPSFSQRELYHSMMSGSGGLFSFEPKCQDEAKIRAFINKLEIFGKGISWGGFESLAVPLQMQPLNYLEPKQLVRLFTGLEDAPDLIADLEAALPLLH